MIRIKKFTNDKIDYACKVCLKHNLYVQFWTFQKWLSYPKSYGVEEIYIIYVDGVPCGNLITTDPVYDIFNFGVFVSSGHRGKGLGKRLVRFASKYSVFDTLIHSDGISGSRDFFKSCQKVVDNLKYDGNL